MRKPFILLVLPDIIEWLRFIDCVAITPDDLIFEYKGTRYEYIGPDYALKLLKDISPDMIIVDISYQSSLSRICKCSGGAPVYLCANNNRKMVKNQIRKLLKKNSIKAE